METQKQAMIHELIQQGCLLGDIKDVPLPPAKDEEISKSYRRKATFMNSLKNHNNLLHQAQWKYCMQSVRAAPPNSEELARAYSERSRYLLHVCRYRDSVIDINQSLAISNTPKDLKIMLLCRKIECSISANLGIEKETLRQAERVFNEIDDNDEEKPRLAEMLESVRKFMSENPSKQVNLLPEESRNTVEPDVSAVKIAYSEKYGRHLIAARDLRVGEIVCVEKLYAAAFSERMTENTICSHCLSTSFTMIPCDTCDRVYCLQSCKDEAWRKYHNIECSVLRKMSMVYKGVLEESIRLALKMVIMGLKEAGSIEKLKELVAEIDACKDNLSRGMTNGEFHGDTFKSFYSLSSPELFITQDYLVRANSITTICLVIHSKIFGPNLTFLDGRDLVKNEDIVFIGALLLKMSEIASVNSKHYFDPMTKAYIQNGYYHFKKKSQYMRGHVITHHTSLINHSCNPNVYQTCTDDNKIVYYSVLPIQKGSQIFESYSIPFYSTLPRAERRSYLKDHFQFGCYCEACTNKWDSAPRQSDARLEHFVLDRKLFISLDIVGPLITQCESFIIALSRTNLAYSELVRKMSASCIETLLMNFPYPNPPVLAFMYILRIAFDYTVGPTMTEIPHFCKRLT